MLQLLKEFSPTKSAETNQSPSPPTLGAQLLPAGRQRADNAGRGEEWQREAEHSCVVRSLSVSVRRAQLVFRKKDNENAIGADGIHASEQQGAL